MRGCERRLTPEKDDRCGRPVVAFALGQNLCAVHDPAGDPNCTHSLAPSGRCAFCGARTSAAVDGETGGAT